jgi:glycosyltransferase involved in cell wall biosynthesis
MRSGQGVDAKNRFVPTESRSRGAELRATLGVPGDAVVIGFVGRFVRDKGLVELTTVWRSLREDFPALHLLLAGDADDTDPVDLSELFSDERVHHVPFSRDMPRVYEAIDLLAFPTYREGFPNVVLEAAAMEVPAVASDAVGSVDSVVDGETGIIVRAHDAESLRRGLIEFVESGERRVAMGRAARQRVLREFSPVAVFGEIAQHYRQAGR